MYQTASEADNLKSPNKYNKNRYLKALETKEEWAKARWFISDWGTRGQFWGLNDLKLREKIPERKLVTEERRLTIYVKSVCKLFSTSWLTLDWIYTEEFSNNQADQWQPKLESENGEKKIILLPIEER